MQQFLPILFVIFLALTSPASSYSRSKHHTSRTSSRSRTDTSGHHSSSNGKYENPAASQTAASKTDSGIYESHTGMENSGNSDPNKPKPVLRPSIKENCFFTVVSCQTKASHSDWDKLDCDGDQKIKNCCDWECSKKRRVLKKALNADKIREAKEAKESLSRLKLLEAQREEILEQLEEAKERVVEIANPALQSNLEDLAAIAGVPQKPQEELETLVGIADAVEKSEVDINPKLIQNLEEKILDNIIEVADENPDYNQDFLYQFISEEQSDFEEKTEEDKVKDFLEENDIMTAKDPFSEFLRGQM